jgi:chemosensory pili system protein ChpC
MAAALSVDEAKELACVMIPLADTHLLLPNVTIAEILPWRRIKPLQNAPKWCLGLLGWRGETVPVIQFEALNGGADSGAAARSRCLLIMNRARRANGRAFYGLASTGLPRIVHLSDDDLQNRAVRLGPAEVAALNVGTEAAVVPNLSFIEEQLSMLP